MYSGISRCRICNNKNIIEVLDLGVHELTGVFPQTSEEKVLKGPLVLVKCQGDEESCCGLVQLKHTVQKDNLYGDNYGYSSSLNQSMVKHLEEIVKQAKQFTKLHKGDTVLDIGSNDGTLLNFLPAKEYNLVGIDPTAYKFKDNYNSGVHVYSDYFTSELFIKHFGQKKAKIVTSIAMFYDLDKPLQFVQDIYNILDDQGIWISEQSYLPTMLKHLAYDTICHEHLEYYALRQVKWMMDKVGFKILDIEFNDINGGSFKIIAAKTTHTKPEITKKVERILKNEKKLAIGEIKTYQLFEKRILKHRKDLLSLIQKLLKQNKKIFGYGASTKGNVVLQFLNLTEKEIPCIAEVNPEKYGHVTPFTHIPIIAQDKAFSLKPDYFIVLPWHFKENILARHAKYLQSGGKFIFPLPKLTII